MSTSDRADLHRMATKIALSYAHCHNEAFDAFPSLFRTAYHGLLSCTQSAQQEPVQPSRKAGVPSRPVAQHKPMAQPKPKAAAPAKASVQHTSTSGASRSWTTWTNTGKKPGRPPKNGAGRYR